MCSSRRILLALSALALVPACSDDSQKPRIDFKVVPTEAGTTRGDGAGSGEGIGPGGPTIADVNKGTIKEGAKVILKDVVVTAVDGYGTYTGDIYVQDPAGGPYSGLKLFSPQRTDGAAADLKAGDHIRVEGTVLYFSPTSSPFSNGKKVIEIAKGGLIAKVSGGAAPAPKELTVAEATTEATAVQWTHMLVTVKNQPVSECFSSQYNEFGMGISVDDELFLVQPAPSFGDCKTVTGILGYFYEYKLWPRAADDIVAGTGCAAVKTVTIKDLQDDVGTGHPASNSAVIIGGTTVITAVDTVLSTGTSPAYQGIWIGDPAGGEFSGIYVYYTWKDTAAVAAKPVVGNLVEVSGTYTEYQPDSKNPATLSEIAKPCVTVKGPGTLPAPAVVANPVDIATGGSKVKNYEGVLVQVQNVEMVAEVKTTGTTPKAVGFTVKAAGATGTVYLNVENEIFDFVAKNPFTAGVLYKSITGVLHYSYGNYKILPRSDADLVK